MLYLLPNMVTKGILQL